jgi:hypothetical protein
MRSLRRREFLAGSIAGMASLAPNPSGAIDGDASPQEWLIGHHFWNWDRAWDTGEFLDRRLVLTKQTGYDGFEAKPHQIGQPAEAVKEKCAKLGIQKDINYRGWIMVERDGRGPDHTQSARNMHDVLRRLGH